MPRPRRGVAFGRRLLLQALLAAAALGLLVFAGLEEGWTALLLVLSALVVGAMFPATSDPGTAGSRPPTAEPPGTLGSDVGNDTDAAGEQDAERDPPPEPIARALAGSDRIVVVLRLLAGSVGADRLVVWQRDPDDDLLVPIAASDELPARLPATGDPLAWALGEGEPMRLDRAGWTPSNVLALPLPGGGARTLLTIETVERTPSDETGAAIAGALAVLLDLEGHRVEAARTQRRLERMVDFLRGIPREGGPGGFPRSLVETAVEVTGASGGLVASWMGTAAETGGEGEVLWTTGAGDGPSRGTRFNAGDGDLGLAAKSRAGIMREPGAVAPPSLANSEEKWSDEPQFRTVLPLQDATGEPRALLALWGNRPLEPEGVQLLEAVGTLLTLQLHNATDLVRFRRQATRDPLTGLANRGRFEDELREQRLLWNRYRRPVALMVLDLDHFKDINDTYGHPAGDAVLRQVAEILMERTRETDLVARYGGEEMVVLMPETMRTPAIEAAERVRSAIEAARIEADDGTVIPVTASIGVSACPESVDVPGELMTSADDALYRSKEEGRNRITPAAVGASGG